MSNIQKYNPANREVKSFLVSKTEQTVNIGAIGQSFLFKQWETVFMELSCKFDLRTIEIMAKEHGFKVEQHFTDNRKYFVDSLWVRE